MQYNDPYLSNQQINTMKEIKAKSMGYYSCRGIKTKYLCNQNDRSYSEFYYLSIRYQAVFKSLQRFRRSCHLKELQDSAQGWMNSDH